MSTVVHYIKHWDNDTKGSIEFNNVANLDEAEALTRRHLVEDAIEDGVHGDDADLAYTITKAEVVEDSQDWTGVPKAGF